MVHDRTSSVLSCVVSSRTYYTALVEKYQNHTRSDETHTLMPPPYIVQSRFRTRQPPAQIAAGSVHQVGCYDQQLREARGGEGMGILYRHRRPHRAVRAGTPLLLIVLLY